MNRPELFTKTYETLVTAWGRGELHFQDGCACAVGNICGGRNDWVEAFSTPVNGHQNRDYLDFGFPRNFDQVQASELIDSTGYTVEELANIEYAFESSIAYDFNRLYGTSEGQYIGLCAVMDVLWEIHEVEDQSLTKLNRVATDKGVEVNA